VRTELTETTTVIVMTTIDDERTEMIDDEMTEMMIDDESTEITEMTETTEITETTEMTTGMMIGEGNTETGEIEMMMSGEKPENSETDMMSIEMMNDDRTETDKTATDKTLIAMRV